MKNRPGARRLLAPDHGGNAIKGGGKPSNSKTPAAEEINDALGYSAPGRGKLPGTADPGVPGSRTNPPDREKIASRAERLWEEEGRPEGKADEHWRRAEEELARDGNGS